MQYPHSELTILGPKAAKILISPKFHSPDPVISSIGFGGRDNSDIWIFKYTRVK